jgi:hypothetical protein
MFIKRLYYFNHHMLMQYDEVCHAEVVGALKIIVRW